MKNNTWNKTNAGAFDAYTNGTHTVVKKSRTEWQIEIDGTTYEFKTLKKAKAFAELGLSNVSAEEAEEAAHRAVTTADERKAERKAEREKYEAEVAENVTEMFNAEMESVNMIGLPIPTEEEIAQAGIVACEDEELLMVGGKNNRRKSKKLATPKMIKQKEREIEAKRKEADAALVQYKSTYTENGGSESRENFAMVAKLRDELDKLEEEFSEISCPVSYGGDSYYVLVRYKTHEDYEYEMAAKLYTKLDNEYKEMVSKYVKKASNVAYEELPEYVRELGVVQINDDNEEEASEIAESLELTKVELKELETKRLRRKSAKVLKNEKKANAIESAKTAPMFAYTLTAKVNPKRPTSAKAPVYKVANTINKLLFANEPKAIDGIAKVIVYANIEANVDESMLATVRGVSKKVADNGVARQGNPTQWAIEFAAVTGDWEHPHLADMTGAAMDSLRLVLASDEKIERTRESANALITVGEQLKYIAPKYEAIRYAKMNEIDELNPNEIMRKEMLEKYDVLLELARAERLEIENRYAKANRELSIIYDRAWSYDRTLLDKLECDMKEKQSVFNKLVVKYEKDFVDRNKSVLELENKLAKATSKVDKATDEYDKFRKERYKFRKNENFIAETERNKMRINALDKLAIVRYIDVQDLRDEVSEAEKRYEEWYVYAEAVEVIAKPFEDVKVDKKLSEADRTRLCEYMQLYDEAIEELDKRKSDLDDAVSTYNKMMDRYDKISAHRSKESNRKIEGVCVFTHDDRMEFDKRESKIKKLIAERSNIAMELEATRTSIKNSLESIVYNTPEIGKLEAKRELLEDKVDEAEVIFEKASEKFRKASEEMLTYTTKLANASTMYKIQPNSETEFAYEELASKEAKMKGKMAKVTDEYMESEAMYKKAVRSYERAMTPGEDEVKPDGTVIPHKPTLIERLGIAKKNALAKYVTKNDESTKIAYDELLTCARNYAVELEKVSDARKKALEDACDDPKVLEAYEVLNGITEELAESTRKVNHFKDMYDSVAYAEDNEAVLLVVNDGDTMIKRGKALLHTVDSVTQLRNATTVVEKALAHYELTNCAFEYVNNYLGDNKSITDNKKTQALSVEEFDEFIEDPRNMIEEMTDCGVREYEVKRTKIVRDAWEVTKKTLTPQQMKVLNNLDACVCENDTRKKISAVAKMMKLSEMQVSDLHGEILRKFSDALTVVAPDSLELAVARLAVLASNKRAEVVIAQIESDKANAEMQKKRETKASDAANALGKLKALNNAQIETAVREAIAHTVANKLTVLQQEQAKLFADGVGRNEIARRYECKPSVVSKTKQSICNKLDKAITKAIAGMEGAEEYIENVHKLSANGNIVDMMGLAM